MIHVEEISARILAIGSGSTAQPENIDAGPSSVKHVQPELASVLHASNRGKYSLMTKAFFEKLYIHRYGPEEPLPSITTDTAVHLQWQYPDFDQLQVTTHLIIHNSPYDVILRKEDWERPIQTWLLQKYTVQQLRQLNILPPLKDGETDGETTGGQDTPQDEHQTDWGSNSDASITPTERSEGASESSDGGYPPSTTPASEPTSPTTTTNVKERAYELRQRRPHLEDSAKGRTDRKRSS
ncbi:hypothetical protein ACJZ2D_005748 [Fusarium nematophilum]